MTGSQPPKVHANWSTVGTKRVMASGELIGRPPNMRLPFDHPSGRRLHDLIRTVRISAVRQIREATTIEIDRVTAVLGAP
jgi:hypothetical protein